MSSFKVVQNSNRLAVSTGVSTSVPINLKSGQVRLISDVNCNVSLGDSPSATNNDFYLAAGESEVLKERVARQKISGITTGTTTTVTFAQNAPNPFLVGEYVSISGASPSGINTSYNLITAVSENPRTGVTSLTIDFNSSSIEGVTVAEANLSRSVKVSALGSGAGFLYISEVQVTS